MPEVHEIIFYGKSGDGIHVVADQLVQSLIKRGFYVISYPEYDPERRETIAKVHVRVSKEPIHVRGPVTSPEIAVFFDVRLIKDGREALSAKKLIVNAPSRELVTKYVGDVNGEVMSINLNELRRAGADYAMHVVNLIINALLNGNA
ncbi:2-oxoacid:acceptor oxidoreductase family protein [Vulcanisaeta sp. JCM 14467]|uniref:2-oxoacid:acceptor oxidoreductase family protein n=1 Tax=Vulcanisaeta sp. JCM 14467 TaxID=1295370 RepID=UPI0006CF324F|nr:2-oxoacid:acceptor oxidoreductase family protein [Vulcanisaeta sp. JCM 14467]